MTRYDFMGPHEIITRHTRPRTRGRRTAPLRSYGTSQLCNSIGMLHELIPLAYEHAVTGKTLCSAIWANTALDHRQARLWIISKHGSGSALALWVRLFGRARLWLFGHGSSGEHGSCPLGEHGSVSSGTPQFFPYSAIDSQLFSKPQIHQTLYLGNLPNTAV